MTLELLDLFILEYSPMQKVFHLAHSSEVDQNALKRLSGEADEFILLGIYTSYEKAAEDMVIRFKPLIQELYEIPER